MTKEIEKLIELTNTCPVQRINSNEYHIILKESTIIVRTRLRVLDIKFSVVLNTVYGGREVSLTRIECPVSPSIILLIERLFSNLWEAADAMKDHDRRQAAALASSLGF